MRTSLIAFTLFAILTHEASADLYIEIGVGTASCGSWTTARQQEQTSFIYEQWVMGFLSGVGYSSDDENPLSGVDKNGVVGWINNYCQANPIESISNAAKEFIRVHPR